MHRFLSSATLSSLVLLATLAAGATKPHVIGLGKWTTVKWCMGAAEAQCQELKVRALYVDGRSRESTMGASHDITERLFVVRRAFRVNDNLPGDAASTHWVWQRGGWMLVDRMTGHISALALPEFDAYYSVASWYRDYAAYCGVSDDGKKLSAIVFQVGRRKPVLKKALGEAGGDDAPDSECPAPVWERRPVRVTFAPGEEQKSTYSIRGHAADLVSSDDDEEEKGSK
ncbi:MAG: hypothetical protein ACRD20_08715 [Terriglobales bacterium]